MSGKTYKNESVLRKLYWGDGMTMQEIADDFDISLSTVQYWMDKHSISRKPKYPTCAYSARGGYPRWDCKNPDGPDYIFIHRLLAVAEYGVDEVKNKHVHHKNGIKWDNRPENIEILPEHDHMSLHWSGENNVSSKLTKDDVKEIKRSLRDTQKSQSQIAQKFDVNQSLISRISRGKRWSDVTIQPE
jgi:transposase-like protein